MSATRRDDGLTGMGSSGLHLPGLDRPDAGPVRLCELADHLAAAASCELFGVATLERMALHIDGELVTSTIAAIKRRAEALGLACRMARRLAARPDLARELGLQEAGQ